ncbi:MAG: ribbon-helix-helix domain-containing protein [Promethearchaeota archaeon]
MSSMKEYMNVGVPMSLVKEIDSIVAEGLYSSRSEFMKDAIRRLIHLVRCLYLLDTELKEGLIKSLISSLQSIFSMFPS